MKIVHKALWLLILFLLLTPAAHAESGVGDLEAVAGEYAPRGDWETGFNWNGGLRDLLDTGAKQAGGVLRAALRSGTLLVCIVLFSTLAEEVGSLGSSAFQAAPVVGVLAVCTVSVADIHSLMGLGRQAMDEMAAFATVLLPVMSAAAAAAGTPASAAARQVATALFSDLLAQLISKILIPLLYLYIALSTASAAMGNKGLERVGKTLKGGIKSTLTVALLVFVGYFSITGAITATTDALSVKTAKMAIGGMVPMVGGVLSDAAETVLAGAGILKNSIGIYGALVILGICLAPFLQMGIHYLVYKLAATLASAFSQSRTVDAMNSIMDAFALMLGMTAGCAMVLLVSIISCLRAAGVA